MEFDKVANQELLDAEWASLILDARRMGMSIEEIRSILAILQSETSVVWSIGEAVV